MYDKLISKKKISYFFVMYFLWEKNKNWNFGLDPAPDL